tara:strand:+ start:1553 stop:1954 length:402 start_codon:yes stop_codon:yes gene_type:complete
MASELKVDKITGVTTAGSISVTGEGNSTTTNLQQGLAKSWANLNGSSFGLRDSFNIASATDSGTGLYDHAFTSAMSNVNYSGTTNGHRDADQAISIRKNENATGSYRVLGNGHTNSTDTDTDSAFSQICGDLA